MPAYDVYYQWFGLGVQLHHSVAKNCFLELSMKDLHEKKKETDQ